VTSQFEPKMWIRETCNLQNTSELMSGCSLAYKTLYFWLRGQVCGCFAFSQAVSDPVSQRIEVPIHQNVFSQSIIPSRSRTS
jgi:hypothetical protein